MFLSILAVIVSHERFALMRHATSECFPNSCPLRPSHGQRIWLICIAVTSADSLAGQDGQGIWLIYSEACNSRSGSLAVGRE